MRSKKQANKVKYLTETNDSNRWSTCKAVSYLWCFFISSSQSIINHSNLENSNMKSRYWINEESPDFSWEFREGPISSPHTAMWAGEAKALGLSSLLCIPHWETMLGLHRPAFQCMIPCALYAFKLLIKVLICLRW